MLNALSSPQVGNAQTGQNAINQGFTFADSAHRPDTQTATNALFGQNPNDLKSYNELNNILNTGKPAISTNNNIFEAPGYNFSLEALARGMGGGRSPEDLRSYLLGILPESATKALNLGSKQTTLPPGYAYM